MDGTQSRRFCSEKKKQNNIFVKIYKACYLGKLDQSFYAHFLLNDLFLGMIRYKDSITENKF